DQFVRFRHAADVRALDRQRAHRQWRQRHRDVAAVKTDDDVFAAFYEAVDAEPRGRRRSNKIDRRPSAAIGHVDDLLRGIRRSAIDYRLRTTLLRRFTLGRIDIDND